VGACRRFLALASLALLGASGGLAADDTGRYSAFVMHEGGRSGTSGSLQPRVFIIDTVEGHLWTWEENTRIEEPGKRPSFGTGLVYQGRVRPGTRMGEVIDSAPVP
jgi:hypothetical protein